MQRKTASRMFTAGCLSFRTPKTPRNLKGYDVGGDAIFFSVFPFKRSNHWPNHLNRHLDRFFES